MNESPSPTSELHLRLYPDPILRVTCSPFPNDYELRKDVGEQMINIMYEHNGLGLSAPQVGLSQSVFVMRSPIDSRVGVPYFNPRIVARIGDIETMEEGCLSLLGKTVKIARHKTIVLEYERIDGTTHQAEYKDLSARCAQHEMDHLKGILILDHINSPLAQRLFIEKYYKLKKKYVRLG